MISFEKKPEVKPAPKEAEENLIEQKRKPAAERKSDTNGARRRERKTDEDNRLI